MNESGAAVEAAKPPSTAEVAHGRAGVIARLRNAAERERQAQIDQLSWVSAAADEWSWIDNCPDDDTTGVSTLVGERLWQFGADGTPEVSEFLTHEIGPALGISPSAAGNLIADVLDLRHRLPLLWEAVQIGAVRVWVARKVATRTRSFELSLEEAHLLDAYLSPNVDGWTPHRILTQLEALIIAVAPARAEARAAARKTSRFAVVSNDEDGVSQLSAQLDAVPAAELDATLTRLADALVLTGDERPVRELRAVALEMLADPARAAHLLESNSLDGAPAAAERSVELVIHLTPDQLADSASEGGSTASVTGTAACGPGGAGAQIIGIGPVVASQLEAILAGASNVTVLPVLDPLEPARAETYEVPPWIRKRLILRDPTVPFPWSSRSTSSARLDADHTIPWPEGATETGNLELLDRKTHRAKTHAGFRVEQVRPGVFCWHTPAGQTLWVTPHGTFDRDPSTSARMETIRKRAAQLIGEHQERLREQRALDDPPPF